MHCQKFETTYSKWSDYVKDFAIDSRVEKCRMSTFSITDNGQRTLHIKAFDFDNYSISFDYNDSNL